MFRYYLKCPAYAAIKGSVFKGSVQIVTLLCRENHKAVLYARLNLSRMAAGNTFLSAEFLFMGNTFQRIKKLMDLIMFPL